VVTIYSANTVDAYEWLYLWQKFADNTSAGPMMEEHDIDVLSLLPML